MAIANGYDGATTATAAAQREAATAAMRARHPSTAPTVGPAAPAGFGAVPGVAPVQQPLPRSDSIKAVYAAQHNFILTQLTRPSLAIGDDSSDSDDTTFDHDGGGQLSRSVSRFV